MAPAPAAFHAAEPGTVASARNAKTVSEKAERCSATLLDILIQTSIRMAPHRNAQRVMWGDARPPA